MEGPYIDNSAEFYDYEAEDSRLSCSSRTSNKSVTKVSLKAAMKEVERDKKKVLVNSVKAKMLLDIAKLSTEIKDEFDKLFVDAEDEGALFIEDKYSFFALKSQVPNLIRWSRMSADRLVKCKSSSEVTSYEPFALVIMPKEQFLQLVLQSSDGIDFEQLGAHMAAVKQSIIDKDHCPKDTRLIIVLIDLERLYTKAQNQINKAGKDCKISLWVDSAISYLIYESDVEVVCWKKAVEFAEYLHTLCRIIDGFQGEELITELDFVEKETRVKPDDSLTGSDLEKFELQQNWATMLQTIPGISSKKANSLIANKEYSCFKRTFDVMNNQSIPVSERATLLQNSFGVSGKNKVVKNEVVLSKRIFQAMITTDGRAKISITEK